ncbi:MAG: ABC transporter permease [Rhizobiales bacterium]|nr:ABC transporter permease [Hyphomicrobiales bacterium]
MALWRIGRGIFVAFCIFWQIFLLAPIVVIVVVSFTSANYMTFPPPGFSLEWFGKIAGLSWFWNSLATSLIVAVASTVIATAVGVVAARALSRHRFPGRTVVEYVLLSPLILPGVVLGFALFNALVFIGMENLGIPNLVAGHVLIGIPFVMRSSWSALAGMDLSLEEAAFSLGANPWIAFWKVVLPTARPGIIAGAILAFTYSFNDLTISVFLTSPEATPLPVQIMSNIEYSADPTPAAVSTLMVGLTLVFFVLIERIVGLKVFTES